jgi:hypothetical protein
MRHKKLYLFALLLGLWAGVIHGLMQPAQAETFRRGDTFGRGGEGGTIVNQTIQNITNTTISVTDQITVTETVDPNIIYDAVGAAVQDWWDLVDTTDNSKKGGKGNPSSKATNTVYYWDVNGVYWHEPNAAPDVVAEGEYQWDSDDDAFEVTDGTTDFLVAQKVRTFQMSIFDPDTIYATDPNIPLMAVESEMFPGGITLLSLGIKTNPSSTYSVSFEERTTPEDGSGSAIETVATSGSSEAEDDGTLTDAAIATGSIIYAILPSGDLDMLQIWGTFYVNDND